MKIAQLGLLDYTSAHVVQLVHLHVNNECNHVYAIISIFFKRRHRVQD